MARKLGATQVTEHNRKALWDLIPPNDESRQANTVNDLIPGWWLITDYETREVVDHISDEQIWTKYRHTGVYPLIVPFSIVFAVEYIMEDQSDLTIALRTNAFLVEVIARLTKMSYPDGIIPSKIEAYDVFDNNLTKIVISVPKTSLLNYDISVKAGSTSEEAKQELYSAYCAILDDRVEALRFSSSADIDWDAVVTRIRNSFMQTISNDESVPQSMKNYLIRATKRSLFNDVYALRIVDSYLKREGLTNKTEVLSWYRSRQDGDN